MITVGVGGGEHNITKQIHVLSGMYVFIKQLNAVAPADAAAAAVE